ncbi:DUF2188 domain-containing protein [Microbacterium sp. P05]|uniref:DUF2188 domain-containing protein n=1 Tax=Microbacterium sp. P05 TaxID=3366948 RepID=UPI003745867C
MAQDEVHTRSNRGQWENYVEGRPELSASFSSKEEAVDQGRALADELGTHHLVDDAEPTGTIIDEPESDDDTVTGTTEDGEPVEDSDPVI